MFRTLLRIVYNFMYNISIKIVHIAQIERVVRDGWASWPGHWPAAGGGGTAAGAGRGAVDPVGGPGNGGLDRHDGGDLRHADGFGVIGGPDAVMGGFASPRIVQYHVATLG